MLRNSDLRVAGVAAVLAVALPTALATSAVGVEAAPAKAKTAKKKCKKAKARSAAKKCKRSLSFREGGDYTMSVPGGPAFGGFVYAGQGLGGDPRPLITYLGFDEGFLDCRYTATGSPSPGGVGAGGYTHPNLKTSTFSFSSPPLGPPEFVRGLIHIDAHWVTPRKILGFVSAQGIAYERPFDPAQDTGPPAENYTCNDRSTPFVARFVRTDAGLQER